VPFELFSSVELVGLLTPKALIETRKEKSRFLCRYFILLSSALPVKLYVNKGTPPKNLIPSLKSPFSFFSSGHQCLTNKNGLTYLIFPRKIEKRGEGGCAHLIDLIRCKMRSKDCTNVLVTLFFVLSVQCRQMQPRGQRTNVVSCCYLKSSLCARREKSENLSNAQFLCPEYTRCAIRFVISESRLGKGASS
jgi:hypothetical protein